MPNGYAMYGYAGFAKFGYATSLRHIRLRHMFMPPMVMLVTPNSVMPHGYAMYDYTGYAIGYAKHGYAT